MSGSGVRVGLGVSVANIVGAGLAGGQVGQGEVITSTGVSVFIGEQPAIPRRMITPINAIQVFLLIRLILFLSALGYFR